MRLAAQKIAESGGEYERAQSALLGFEQLIASLPIAERREWIARATELRAGLNSLPSEDKAEAPELAGSKPPQGAGRGSSKRPKAGRAR